MNEDIFPKTEAEESAWDEEPEQAMILRPAPVDQAKVARTDAVSSLLAKAYEKASTLVLTADEIKALREPFKDEMVSAGAKGKPDLLYIQHIHLSDRLNDIIGVGQWALVRRSEKMDTASGRVYVDAALLIRGSFVAEAIGAAQYQASNRMMDYSDAIESALSDALSRCCKRLGIGSQVWDKAFCAGWHKRQKAAMQKATKAKAKPVEPEDESQEPASEVEEPAPADRNRIYLATIENERKRIGDPAYMEILVKGFGVTKPEEITGWEERRRFYNTLKSVKAVSA